MSQEQKKLSLLQRKREILRSLLEKSCDVNDLETDDDISVRAQCVEMQVKELSKLENEIMDLQLAIGEYSIEEAETALKFKELGLRFVKHHAFAENKRCENSTFRLPKLSLQSFDLCANNYLSFWAQYKRIYEDPNISVDDKYYYLLDTVEGKARHIVKSYPPSEENLEKIITQLKKRFGKDEMIVEVHIRNLLDLVLNQKNNLSDLYDKLNTQIRALESLGFTCGAYSAFIYPLVESALPDDVLMLWSRYRSSNDCSEENINASRSSVSDEGKPNTILEKLMAFIENEVNCIEKVNLAQSLFKNNYDSNFDDENISVSEEDKPLMTYATTLCNFTKPNRKSDPQTCVFCEGFHMSSCCRKAKKMHLHEKRKLLMTRRLCFKCLRSDKHRARDCFAPISCPKNCPDKHLLVMCPNQSKCSDHLPLNETNSDISANLWNHATLLDKPKSIRGSNANSDHNRCLLAFCNGQLKRPSEKTPTISSFMENNCAYSGGIKPGVSYRWARL